MEQSSASALGRLLVISAIDLLLCCFTMGVMLFLVFQPSLRPDRPTALGNGVQAGVGANAAGGVGAAVGTPVVLIVRNIGENRLRTTGLPSEFRAVGSSQLSDGIEHIVYVSERAEGIPRFSLLSVGEEGATVSSVWFVANDQMWSADIACDIRAIVTIDVGRDQPIEFECDSTCPLGAGKVLEAETSIVDSGIARLALFDQGHLPRRNKYFGWLCLAGLEVPAASRGCNLEEYEHDKKFLSQEMASCVRNNIERTRAVVKVASCSALLGSNEKSAIFALGRPRREGASEACTLLSLLRR